MLLFFLESGYCVPKEAQYLGCDWVEDALGMTLDQNQSVGEVLDSVWKSVQWLRPQTSSLADSKPDSRPSGLVSGSGAV